MVCCLQIALQVVELTNYSRLCTTCRNLTRTKLIVAGNIAAAVVYNLPVTRSKTLLSMGPVW